MREGISILFHLPVIFICHIFYNLCYAKLTNNKINWSLKNIFITFISSILILFNNYFNMVFIKIIFNFFILITQLKLIFKNTLKKIVINYIFMYFLIIAIEMILTNVLMYLNILTNNLSAGHITLVTSIMTIIDMLIEYLIISNSIIKKYFQRLISILEENKSSINILYLIFIGIMIIALINIENFANKNSIRLIFSLCVIFIILFSIIVRLEFNTTILKISNKKLTDYNNNYGKFLDEYKIYKHNINNKLLAIKEYGNKKTNELINDLLEEETKFSFRNNEICKVPNGIKGLIAEKLYNKNYDIIINNNIKKDSFGKLTAKSFNSISECLGIALDNAIEAAEETTKPFIIINLDEDDKNIYVKLQNPYCNNIDINSIGEKKYSTKNRDSGYGLFSINKNRFVKEKITITNGIFNIDLILPKNKKTSF